MFVSSSIKISCDVSHRLSYCLSEGFFSRNFLFLSLVTDIPKIFFGLCVSAHLYFWFGFLLSFFVSLRSMPEVRNR